MANATNLTGTKVTVWTGETGEVLYQTADGWYGVRLDGETTTHEWQASQIEAAS